MVTIVANTTEELYKAIAAANETSEQTEIILKKHALYEITSPLKISNDNISIKGEKSVLRGSKRIDINGSGGIITLKLDDYGIKKISGFSGGPYKDFWFDYAIPKPYMDDCGMGTMVFYNDTLLPLSRYPKKGFVNVEKVMNENGDFIPEDERIFTWQDYSELLAVGYWQWEWANQRCFIDRINTADKVISLKEPYHIFGYKDGAHYYMLNVKDEISLPGEWVKSVEDNTVTLYLKKKQDYVNITVAQNIIEASNVKKLHISGIVFKECEKNAIKIKNSKNVTIDNCEIKNVGAWAVIADNCQNTVIKNVVVNSTAAGGISVSGGNREQLISSKNIIEKCVVTNVAFWHRTYTPAIQICGVGGTVRDCRIYNVPHFAIVYHGNNHIIEKCEIFNACYESNDAGAIYSGADWSCRGNIIRENYFHDINGFQNKGCYGIYFDDSVSSAEVYDNLFVNVYQGILIGGGRDYIIHDNFFYDGVTAILIDDRTNVFNKDWSDVLFKRINAVNYKSEIWKKAYPTLYDIENQNYECEQNNRIYNNKAVKCHNEKNFVYIKNGESLEYEFENDFVKNNR